MADLRRSELLLTRVRWFGVAFAAFEVATYGARPWPEGAEARGLALAGALLVGNVLVRVMVDRVQGLREATRLALLSLALDAAVVTGYVWLFAFDRSSVQWLVAIFLPLEAATRFHLRGAILAWGAMTVAYSMREVIMTDHLGEGSPWSSIVFRMGVLLMVSLIAGGMAADQHRQRERAEEAADELRRVDALRRNLITTLAHDVRAPLTAVQGTIDLLQHSAALLSPDQLAELLQLADRQASRLGTLMLDLLDLARLETGRLELQRAPLDLSRLVRETADYIDPEGRFDFDLPDELPVVADTRRVEQILVNLMSNAIRYGAAPRRLSASRDANGVRVVVEDGGSGVAPDVLPQLFEPFGADRASEASVGLGLWIARSLAEAHGGTLTYDRAPGGGARFTLFLPDGEVAPS